MADARPIRLLIAALGGEGGGVLASWLHAAAIASGHFVQGTYIPGVAQRTGATTYYLELVPGAGERHRTPAARPVLALNAAPGEVDLVVASELLEATRAIGAGFVTPDRTDADRLLGARVHRRREGGHGRRPARSGAHAGHGEALLAPRRRSPISPPSRRKPGARSTPCCSVPLPPPACCRSRPTPSAPPSAPRARRWTPTCAASRRGWRGSDPLARASRGQTAIAPPAIAADARVLRV